MFNRKRLFNIIQIGSDDDILSRAFDIFLSAVIVANILVTFLDTFDELAPLYPFFGVIEAVTITIFVIEYVLRLFTADLLYPKLPKWKAVLRFIFSTEGMTELLTILPLAALSGFVAFRILRILRIFRLFRINANDDSFTVITGVLYEKRNQILSSLFIILILMLASSLGIYSAEHEVQPEIYKNAFSGIWWSAATLLTVGYGDIYPVTTMGQIMAIIIAFLGVGAVAIPTGIISAGFVEQYTRKENEQVTFNDIEKIGEIEVGADSPLLGLTVGSASEKYELKIYLIMRDDMQIIASDNIKIRRNDIIIGRSARITSRPKPTRKEKKRK